MTAHLSPDVTPAPLESILAMRDEYRREMNCQIVHDCWHVRSYTRAYLLIVNGETVGYGSVGAPPPDMPDIVKEFYLQPDFRGLALPLFRKLVAVSGAQRIAAQTNDPLLSLLFFDRATDWRSEWILFADRLTTELPAPGVTFRPLSEADRAGVFAHQVEPVGNWGLEREGEIVATGGVLFHYNPPFGDLFMEVAEPFRRRGFGSYLVQELKRACYESGHLPGARCLTTNVGSRGALQRTGMLPCGRILNGRLASAGDRPHQPESAVSA